MGAPEHRLVNDDINDSIYACPFLHFSWAEIGQRLGPDPVGYQQRD